MLLIQYNDAQSELFHFFEYSPFPTTPCHSERLIVIPRRSEESIKTNRNDKPTPCCLSPSFLSRGISHSPEGAPNPIALIARPQTDGRKRVDRFRALRLNYAYYELYTHNGDIPGVV